MGVEKGGGTGKGMFQKLAENEKYRKIVVTAGILGIVLILLSGNLQSCGGKQSSQTASSRSSGLSAENYEKQLETNLTEIISQIRGTGNVRVMVTLEQTTQYVYATEEKKSDQQTDEKAESGTGKKESNNSDETTYLLVKDADGSERALHVTEIQPVVKGVVVVCDGGDDPQVQQDVTDAVTTALHITSVRVCVIKAK
jgi:stage III sporulation protein AG